MNFHELASLIIDIHDNYYNIGSAYVAPLPIISSDNTIKTYHSYIKNAVKLKKINSVDIYLLDYRQKHILGRFQKYNDYADILISNSLNHCWKRYVTAKELSHLIIDTKTSYMTTDVNAMVMWMLHDGMPANVNDALDSEHIAAQFAAELLLPYHLTQSLLRDPSIDSISIANQFKVPLRIVQVMRLEDGYLDKRDKAYLDS